jgi:hypothetical protein
MAKKNLGRLAGLAALAGAAYMASKGKDKDDAGDQKTSSYSPADTRTKEASLESPEDTIKRSMKKSDGDSKPITEADVVMPEKAAPKTATAPRTSTTAKTAPRGDSSRVNLEAGMSRGRPAVAKNPDYSNEGRNAPAPAAKPDLAPASPAKKEYYRSLSGKMVEKTPTKISEDDADSGMLGKRMRAALGSSYKKGGATKKMASGGMTASKRADGIASRGKTNCKMY